MSHSVFLGAAYSFYFSHRCYTSLMGLTLSHLDVFVLFCFVLFCFLLSKGLFKHLFKFHVQTQGNHRHHHTLFGIVG